jgi:hypothetical protein
MRDLKELRIDSYGKPNSRPAPTAEEIKEIETALGFPLPSEYIQFLMSSNGGTPRLNVFSTDQTMTSQWAIALFYFLSNDRESLDSIWRALMIHKSVIGPKRLPIAEDGFGNQIILDFNNSQPTVMVSVHDEGFRTITVAGSFKEFIDSLTELSDATKDIISQALEEMESDQNL